ncbi:hypothetical protein AB0H73_39085 [Streptomyces olivoreticuli]
MAIRIHRTGKHPGQWLSFPECAGKPETGWTRLPPQRGPTPGVGGTVATIELNGTRVTTVYGRQVPGGSYAA